MKGPFEPRVCALGSFFSFNTARKHEKGWGVFLPKREGVFWSWLGGGLELPKQKKFLDHFFFDGLAGAWQRQSTAT